MKEELLVVKIGGNVIEDEQTLHSFLADFARIKQPKILIHGGGKLATQLAAKLKIKTEMIDGRRITSAENLEVVVMTYAGLLNKKIVAQLQKNNCNAIGLSGADGNSIQSKKREVQMIDYGWVGDVVAVNHSFIHQLLSAGVIPIFCAVTHDKEGHLLNTNADTIAATVASGMSALYATSLFYCFELKGVLEDIKDKDSVISEINLRKYNELVESGSIADGMLPKLHNCFEALKGGVEKVHIANSEFLKNPGIVHTVLRL
ncbi:acetylglutamate kinase [Aquimarina sp. ERC-38]|uniref:acetylglutamate kinase n=1 Tax=Aquimarina sp. ERC-38 TaxID=2949996 RepID=UPI002247365D|nr:acetylglutamate kinase [Aquimarina sp. ERC-38]UZO79913.1 acetylglutamate kinase [Aquimarina sp. ERC-38]